MNEKELDLKGRLEKEVEDKKDFQERWEAADGNIEEQGKLLEEYELAMLEYFKKLGELADDTRKELGSILSGLVEEHNRRTTLFEREKSDAIKRKMITELAQKSKRKNSGQTLGTIIAFPVIKDQPDTPDDVVTIKIYTDICSFLSEVEKAKGEKLLDEKQRNLLLEGEHYLKNELNLYSYLLSVGLVEPLRSIGGKMHAIMTVLEKRGEEQYTAWEEASKA